MKGATREPAIPSVSIPRLPFFKVGKRAQRARKCRRSDSPIDEARQGRAGSGTCCCSGTRRCSDASSVDPGCRGSGPDASRCADASSRCTDGRRQEKSGGKR